MLSPFIKQFRFVNGLKEKKTIDSYLGVYSLLIRYSILGHVPVSWVNKNHTPSSLIMWAPYESLDNKQGGTN
jgi:hypothetical protein